ncbi:MAG: hypothetical protein ACRBDX_12075 [Gammaproteobacteria bacterium]
MSEPLSLDQRVVKLERIMFTMRIAVVVLVGFMIYDSLAPETGSDIVFANKIKARQFVLLGPGDEPIGYWDYKDTKGLKLYSKEGSHIIVSPDAVTFYEDKLNPQVKSKYD